MPKDFFTLILKSIRYRPMRSWLTVLGIIIGIMLVVTIFSISSGVQNVISKTLQMFGSDLIILFPGKETNPIAGLVSGQKFREKDIADLETIEGVKFATPLDVVSMNVEVRGEKKGIMVHGVKWKEMRTIFEESQGVHLLEGAWPETDDKNEVVLGYLTANSLFKSKIKAGDEIIVKSRKVVVSGVLARIGTQDDDNSMYFSLDILQHLTGRQGAISALIKTNPDANIDLVARQIKFKLSKQEVVPDFSVLTPENVNRLIGSVLSLIEFVLIIIALVSLLVGAVGIMNTMYTSVLERTKHIGILKAIGASSEAILSMFLIESGLIGLIGGALGVILGIALAYIIGLIASNFGIEGFFSFASLDYLGLFVILIIAFITGMIAGFLPARAAAKMEPAEALRYE